MANSRKITFVFFSLISLSSVAQTAQLDNYYYQGKEILVKLNGFTSKDILVRLISDRMDTTTVTVKDLDKTGSSYFGTLLGGMCNYPGLRHFKIERLTTNNKITILIDSFAYIASSGQAQLQHPYKPNSFLAHRLSAQEADTAQNIRDNLLGWRDSLKTVFNLLKFDSVRIRNKTDTIRYSLDSLYAFLDTMAVKMATNIDSGKIVAFNYIIDFPKGLTLVNFMKDTLLGTDKMTLYDHHFRMAMILEQLEEKWKEDLLISDAETLRSKWKPWLDRAMIGDVQKDRLLIFPKEDNFATTSLLHQYSVNYNATRSRIWIGFSPATEDRLLMLVRLTGTKSIKRKQ